MRAHILGGSATLQHGSRTRRKEHGTSRKYSAWVSKETHTPSGLADAVDGVLLSKEKGSCLGIKKAGVKAKERQSSS